MQNSSYNHPITVKKKFNDILLKIYDMIKYLNILIYPNLGVGTNNTKLVIYASSGTTRLVYCTLSYYWSVHINVLGTPTQTHTHTHTNSPFTHTHTHIPIDWFPYCFH